MDGVIVAYHNTARLFGFQYIPLDEIDECLFGRDQGDRVFQKCVGLLEEVADEMSRIFPEKVRNLPITLRCPKNLTATTNAVCQMHIGHL